MSKKYEELFTPVEKGKLFDEIADYYYRCNFGTMSKSEIDLLMFKFYFEKMMNKNMNKDGTLNYNAISDYQIANRLGITESRVRSLKVKYHLKYGNEFDWKKAFAKLVSNARYEKDTHKIIVNIPDPNLYREIQNYIEENGAYVEKQLNSKLLQIRVEYFIALVLCDEPEDNRKKIIKKLKEQFKEANKSEDSFDEKNIGKSLIDIACNVSSVVTSIIPLFSSGNEIGNALKLFSL